MATPILKTKASYLIPKSLARRIRQEAARTDRWPADVVVEACEKHLRRRFRVIPREADPVPLEYPNIR